MILWRITYLLYLGSIMGSILMILANFVFSIASGYSMHYVLLLLAGIILLLTFVSAKVGLDTYPNFKRAEKEFDGIAGYKEEDDRDEEP